MSHPKIKPTPKHVSFFKEHKLDLVATVAAFISLIILFVDNIKYALITYIRSSTHNLYHHSG